MIPQPVVIPFPMTPISSDSLANFNFLKNNLTSNIESSRKVFGKFMENNNVNSDNYDDNDNNRGKKNNKNNEDEEENEDDDYNGVNNDEY